MKEDLVYVEHVLLCISRVETYTAGNRQMFLETLMVQDAVIRNLQVLAESSQRISATVKSKYPNVDWRGLAGFRNLLAHGYLAIDIVKVWDLIDTHLAPLKLSMGRIQADLISQYGTDIA